MNSYAEKIEITTEFPQLKSFLGIPLITQDKAIGIIGLFNSIKTYNKSLLESLDPIFQLSTRIINDIKMQRNQKDAEKEALGRKQAEAENLAKSSFLAHMSHEIRTPLGGLLGMLSLINKEYLHEEDLNYLQIAHGAGLSVLSLLNDILDISKVEAGQLKLESVQFNPLMIAQEVVQLLALEAEKKGIDLKLYTGSKVPLHLIGDPTRLRQILSNLVGNAIKFTSKGSVAVSFDGNSDNGNFILAGSVIDTGIGISSEAKERLFKPFSQADSSILRQYGGTGLGLFITKQLCEMMGGSVSVESEVGKGSTFSFKVRLGRYHGLMPLVESYYPLKILNKLPNIRVLVAEDNAINQLILRTLLEKAGCVVDTAWNGQEAVEAILGDHYDVVLMDGEMPIMDGLKATQKIREVFDADTLPIIGVTAHAMIEDRERFLQSGMNGYLTKPIQKESLFAEIMRCCYKKPPLTPLNPTKK